jgi:alpha-N-arabinofuranosidase
MSDAKLILNKHYLKNQVDKRLFGSFVEHMGSTVYGGIFEPGHPEADGDGFRTDVLKLVRELALPVIRYPGGNFTCSYFWEDSVGPVEKRPTRMELAWRQLEPNTFGLAEFMKWIKKAGSETIMAVNLGTRGIQDAANLVEYCNHPGGTLYSDLRRSHGNEQPFAIKTWCVGNETDGPWQIARRTPEDYAWTAAEAAKAMRRVDPTIELVAVGSSTPELSTYPEWDRTVLYHTYDEVDYISLHHYLNPVDDLPSYLCKNLEMDRQIKTIIAACDYVKAVKRSNKTINLCFDEYNVTNHGEDEFTPWQIGSPIDRAKFNMKNSLLFGSVLMTLIRNSDRVKIACQSLLVNTGPLIVTDKGGASWVNSLYYPMQHASLYGRGRVMEQNLTGPSYSCGEYGAVDGLDTVSVYREKDGEITVFAVNRTEKPIALETVTDYFSEISPVEHILLRHDDMDAVNDAAHRTLSSLWC